MVLSLVWLARISPSVASNHLPIEPSEAQKNHLNPAGIQMLKYTYWLQSIEEIPVITVLTSFLWLLGKVSPEHVASLDLILN